ncbi:MAG: EAL domain-containing protein [Ruminococcus sp.]|nr:EAL domain-containing protein [Ruminococcus sp.]
MKKNTILKRFFSKPIAHYKALIYILITSLLCFGALGTIIYRSTDDTLITNYKDAVMDIAMIASEEINGDDFVRITCEEDAEYSQVMQYISKYQDTAMVKYIYTLKKLDENTLAFVVDADPSHEERAACGEEYEYLPSMRPAFDGSVCCSDSIETDRWGSYISAYAPIFSSDGTVAGIVGCDVETSYLKARLNVFKNTIVAMTSLFFFICFAIIYASYASMTKKDLLTGIWNYETLISYGNRLHKRNLLHNYTAIQINIKNFKLINSSYGSNYGDIVLQQYAVSLSGLLKKNEFIFRIGGDNFVILLNKKHEEHFREQAACINISIFINKTTETLQIFSRCGIYEIQKNDTIREVLDYTSMALKSSYNSISGDSIKFEKSMHESILQTTRILSDFHRALGVNEFVVFYQPKVNIETNTLCGAEALVRWIKNGKIIPPSEFISVLEKENNIAELDFYVFETVCKHICEWQQKGITPVRISSNFSKVHLANPEFAEKVLETVNKYNVDPDLLEIELTESSGYSNYNALTLFVNKMNDAHIHTSIDDFGTGYSSLSMLKDINVDVVKIDKSFLKQSDPDDAHQEKLLENIIKMINDLDRTVICEGIENKKQLNFLKNAECNIVQGYFFDKPLPHHEFELRLKNPGYGSNE